MCSPSHRGPCVPVVVVPRDGYTAVGAPFAYYGVNVRLQRINSFAYNGHATPKGKVRLMGYRPIKPHESLIVSRPANSIPFLGCPRIMEAPGFQFLNLKHLLEYSG